MSEKEENCRSKIKDQHVRLEGQGERRVYLKAQEFWALKKTLKEDEEGRMENRQE